MKDCSLATEAGIINDRAAVDIGATVEEQSDCGDTAVFRGHMQEGSSLECEASAAGHPAIEFGETLLYNCGIDINLFRQPIEPAAYFSANQFPFRAMFLTVDATDNDAPPLTGSTSVTINVRCRDSTREQRLVE